MLIFYKGNIYDVDFDDMQLISKFKKSISSLLCVTDIYSKDAQIVSLINKKNCLTIANPFQNILDEPNHKPNLIRVDKGSGFYNKSMKSWFQDNDK